MAQESDNIDLLTEVASLYYECGYTQEQIARVMQISRSGISRLLTRSRELGLVDIQVKHSLQISLFLREALRKMFSLQDAQVLQSGDGDQSELSLVGALAARYLNWKIQERQEEQEAVRQCVGVTWGESVHKAIKALKPKHRIPLDIVQLMGSVDAVSGLAIDAPENVRKLANSYGGNCHYLHAPLIVDDAELGSGLRMQRSLRRTLKMMERLDIALLEIGEMATQDAEFFEEQDRALLEGRRAVGEICGYYFDSAGRFCAPELAERTISLPLEILQRVPLVVAVAAGAHKIDAIVGALNTKLINVLVTDEASARLILHRAAIREITEDPN